MVIFEIKLYFWKTLQLLTSRISLEKAETKLLEEGSQIELSGKTGQLKKSHERITNGNTRSKYQNLIT